MDRQSEQRERIVHEAARIICEHGVRDYRLAKEKACNQLGLSGGATMPANTEIRDAVREYLSLFFGEAHGAGLREKRRVAIRVMRDFSEFEPRLVGAVLDGTAAPDHPVQLHLFGDCVEQLDLQLLAAGIPYESTDKRLRYGAGKWQMVPACAFSMDDIEFEAMFFDFDDLRRAPDCPVTGMPMRRAARAAVEQLATASDEPASDSDSMLAGDEPAAMPA